MILHNKDFFAFYFQVSFELTLEVNDLKREINFRRFEFFFHIPVLVSILLRMT